MRGTRSRQRVIVALVPAVGLVVVNLLTIVWRDSDTATTDAYVRAYHQRAGTLRLSSLWRKIVASTITLGSGNAFGFEGPSMLIGGTIGSAVDGRFASRLRRDDAKLLMVAGASVKLDSSSTPRRPATDSMSIDTRCNTPTTRSSPGDRLPNAARPVALARLRLQPQDVPADPNLLAIESDGWARTAVPARSVDVSSWRCRHHSRGGGTASAATR